MSVQASIPNLAFVFSHHHFDLMVHKKKLLELFSGAFRNLNKIIFLSIPL